MTSFETGVGVGMAVALAVFAVILKLKGWI